MNALLRKVAKELRYLLLTDIIGSRVTIHSIETIQADILHSLSPPLPATAVLERPEQRFLIGALIKYGLMDLTFAIPEPIATGTDAPGILLLQQLGFVIAPKQHPAVSADGAMWSDDPTCLAELADSLNMHHFVVRLFLELPPDTDGLPPLDDPAHWFAPFRLPTSYFPKTFTVSDACMSNAGFVWFHKHFYV